MLPSVLVSQVAKLKFLLGQNSSTILTGMGVVGTVSTAYLTGRASFKSAELIRKAEESETYPLTYPDPDKDGEIIEYGTATKNLALTEKVKLVWPFYIPAVTSGMITVIAILTANRIDSKRIAALTVASGISDRALQEYKEKVAERLTARQQTNIRDEIAQDHVHQKPVPSGEVLMIGEGQVLCYDVLTGRYFYSTVEDIKAAQNKLNHDIMNHMGASLAEFHDELGLPATPYTDMVGWNPDNLIEVEFSSVLKDKKPVLAINFNYPPIHAYMSLH